MSYELNISILNESQSEKGCQKTWAPENVKTSVFAISQSSLERFLCSKHEQKFFKNNFPIYNIFLYVREKLKDTKGIMSAIREHYLLHVLLTFKQLCWAV